MARGAEVIIVLLLVLQYWPWTPHHPTDSQLQAHGVCITRKLVEGSGQMTPPRALQALTLASLAPLKTR